MIQPNRLNARCVFALNGTDATRKNAHRLAQRIALSSCANCRLNTNRIGYNASMVDFQQITDFIIVLLAIAGSISVIGAAIKTIKEWFKPTMTVNDRLEKVENQQHEYDDRISSLEDANKLILKALSVQLEHAISGNHIDKLQEVQNDINDYLINK